MASLFAPFLLHEALFGGSPSAYYAGAPDRGSSQLLLRNRPHSASAGKGRSPASRFHVAEDSSAYTLAVGLPGYTSADVEVTVDPSSRLLHVKGKPSGTTSPTSAGFFPGLPRPFSKTFELAPDADQSRAAASVTDGVLVIRVPKAQPIKTAVPVSPDSSFSPDPDHEDAAAAKGKKEDTDGERYYSVSLPVPGLRASDLAAELTTPAKGTTGPSILTVRVAAGAEGGAWASRYLASAAAAGGALGRYELPADAGSRVEAICADGMLRLRVAKQVTKLQVVASSSEQQQQQQQMVALASLALPGYTPSDVSAELREKGSLLVVSAKHQHATPGAGLWTHASHALRLPRRVVDAAAGAQLILADGLLRLAAPEAALEPAAEGAARAIDVGKAPLLIEGEPAAAADDIDDQEMEEGPGEEVAPALELENGEGGQEGAPAAAPTAAAAGAGTSAVDRKASCRERVSSPV